MELVSNKIKAKIGTKIGTKIGEKLNGYFFLANYWVFFKQNDLFNRQCHQLCQ